jgi:hypothetical protein
VRRVLALRDGTLLAGGNFTSAGDTLASNLARWDGSDWSEFGGTDAAVESLAELDNGDVVVGGGFSQIGGRPIRYLARWNGSEWAQFGPGVDWNVVDIAVLPGREMVVAGGFRTAGGFPSAMVARWTDTGVPWVAEHPGSTRVQGGQTVTFTATPATAYAGVFVQWFRDGVPLVDGPSGGSPGGGTVAGSFQSLGSRTDGSPARLQITGVRESDGGTYAAKFFNQCGEAFSASVRLLVGEQSLCDYDFNRDLDIDLTDAHDMAAVFTGLRLSEPGWLDGDLNGDENADLTDAQLLAAYVVSGTCGV